MSRHRPPLLVAALLVLAGLVPLADARAGTFTHVVCAVPWTGASTTPSGQLPDGIHVWSHSGAMLTANQNANCGGDGVPMPQNVTTSQANYGGTIAYRAEPLRFVSAAIYRSWTGSSAWGLYINRGSWEDRWTSPWSERCSANDGCTSVGSPAAKFSVASYMNAPAGSAPTNGFNMSVLCNAANGSTVCAADSGKGLNFYGARVVLEDDTDPKIEGTPSGDLVDDAFAGRPLRGVDELTIAGSDTLSGLYRIRVLADNQPAIARTVNTNSGRCVDLDPTDEVPQFAWRQPCRASANGTYEFDTKQLPEGVHNLKVLLEDASGNTATVVNRSVTIDNYPAPVASSAPAVSGTPRAGSVLSVAPAAFDDHGLPGDPTVSRRWERCRANGTGCTEMVGVSGTSYELGAGDLNRALRVTETATNSEGSVSTTSALTDRVTRADGTLPTDNDDLDNDGDGTVDEPGETVPGPVAPGRDGASGLNGRDGASAISTTTASHSTTTSSSTRSAASTTLANGDDASPDARLTVGFAQGGEKGTVVFGKTATARGRLLTPSGRPIRNAIVEVVETPMSKGAKALPARSVATDANGGFVATVSSRGGNRSVAFLYRYQRTGDITAAKAIALAVRAGVRLSVQLRGITVTYRGQVLAGAMPKGGKLVIVQGRARGGSWQTFASRRATKSGTFTGKYRLKVRRPGKRLQFRVRVLGESGWNYGATTSKAITRTVR